MLCDRSKRVEDIENLHQGLIRSNSWILFEHFEHLSDECLSSLSNSIKFIRNQFEQTNEFFQQKTNLRKSTSQPNLSVFQHKNRRENDFPTKRSDRPCLVTENSNLISFPLTYGLFATYSSTYRPLSTSIKVKNSNRNQNLKNVSDLFFPSEKFECRIISMLNIDLKMLIRSLFYQHRIFSMKEQEDCRETSENLYFFLESFQQIVRFEFFVVEKNFRFVSFSVRWNSFDLFIINIDSFDHR